MPAVLHLIAGSTGAGQTTYAMALAAREGGVRLSIDEWMTALYTPDQPARPDFAWMVERVDRCEDRMWDVARQVALLGKPAVIDCGLTRASHRAKWAAWAAAAGLPVRLHHLDVPREERWRRVQARNAERGATYRLEVTPGMFEFVEGLWEPPTEAEMAAMDGVRA